MALFNANDLLSKAKGAVSAVSDTAKKTIDSAKENYAQAKQKQEEYKQEMLQKANQYADELVNNIISYTNNRSLFEQIDHNELIDFTKNFFDKILLPASSVSYSNVSMYPYISDKQKGAFAKTWETMEQDDTQLIYINILKKREFLITEKYLYFSIVLEEDNKFFAKGRVSTSEISKISFEKNEDNYMFMCDENVLATIADSKVVSEDFKSLNNYFECIANHDFEITDQEVDALIKEKIGEKIYNEVKKYLVYDDELFVYWAWGINSLSAKDYVVCTNKQIIIVDREMMGATANITQFYYEDITAAKTLQNSNSNDLAVALIETAITASTKTCDLILTVAGANTKISTLLKVEAERVVAVYHEFRKMLKTQTAVPQQVVVQAESAPNPVEQLKKLAELKDMGILSEDEFNAKKAELLSKI